MLEEEMSALGEKRNTGPYFCLVRPSGSSLACPSLLAPLSSGLDLG